MFGAHRVVSAIVLAVALGCVGVHGAAAQSKKPQDNTADEKEVFNYVLTLDKVHKVGAAMKDLDDFQKTHPELANAAGDSGDGSIDQSVQKIEKYPQAVAVIRKNGFTTREFVVASMTLTMASTAVAFKKGGTYKEYPAEMLRLVSQANLTLVENNFDEISKIMAALGGGGPGGSPR
jgi:hypothetical protein